MSRLNPPHVGWALVGALFLFGAMCLAWALQQCP